MLKERNTAYYKEYYSKNRERLLAYQRKHNAENKEKRLEYGREWRKRNPEKAKEYAQNRDKEKRREYQRLWRASKPEYFRELRKKNLPYHQEYKRKWRIRVKENLAGVKKPDICDICREKGKIVFDHCHTTGDFRGWICGKCNVALGMADDNIDKLQSMINYLTKHYGK